MKDIIKTYIAGILTGMIVFGTISWFADNKTKESQKSIIKTAMNVSGKLTCLQTATELIAYFTDKQENVPDCDVISKGIAEGLTK